MSFSAAHDIKEQIRGAVDIVELVGSYLELRRQGRIYVALCPWHDDSRPSLQVNPERQSWKCWVCNVGGDVFSFVMQREGVEFREALTILAERAGIALTQRPAGPPGGPQDKQALYQTAAWAEQQFHECLLNSPDAEPARRYLQNRGIEDSSVKRFRLGFSPDQWQWMRDRATSASIPPALLEAIDLVGRSSTSGRQYERFKGRVIFPIRDTQNRPIAFGGRILPEFADDKSAKYVNSSETRLFSKSQHVYGLNVVRDTVAKKRHALVVEGYTDAIVAYQCGVDNVVAVLGTALGAGHIRLLRRFADVVTLVLDGDEAGQRRTNEVLELFVASQLDLRIVTLPGGLDPCDFLMQNGREEFERQIAQAPDALDHKIHVATHGVDLSRDTHRANQALEEILITLAKSPSGGVDAGQARLRQQQVLSRLSREFRVDEAELRLRLRSMRRAPTSAGRRENTTREKEPGLDSWERSLFELLTQRPELAAAATQSIPASELQTRAARALWELYVSFCSQNEVPEFGRVLTALDDPVWKNLLVEVDESAQAKSFDDAEQHLQGLIAAFERRAHERQTRDVISTLESNNLSEEEQLSVLHELIDRQRRKHDQT